MTTTKYETRVLPNLEKITEWARAGATAKEIAGKLHIACSTFRRYLDDGKKGEERYAALSTAFAQACAVSDDAVEAALYKRACGYQYTETTVEEKLDRDGSIQKLTKTVVKDVAPDPTSAKFWLTNRRADRWRDKPESAGYGAEGGGVVILSPVMEARGCEAATGEAPGGEGCGP